VSLRERGERNLADIYHHTTCCTLGILGPVILFGQYDISYNVLTVSARMLA